MTQYRKMTKEEDDLINDLVDEWHDSSDIRGLPEYLKMNHEEYSTWVTKNLIPIDWHERE